jgi:DNA-binding GntR family transcriptional regulator
MQNKTLNDTVYKKIYTDIMRLELEPGMPVSVQKLADMYGVSRTPVREAVVRLQQEGLTIIYPQAKTIISPIDLSRIVQERFIRSSLEMAAIDDFVNNCSVNITGVMENMVCEMRQLLGNRASGYQFYIADEEFHKTIFDTAGKSLAYQVIRTTNSHYNRLRILSLKQEGIDKKIINEHLDIVEAAKERNAARLRLTLYQHLNKVQDELTGMTKTFPQYFKK